MSDSALERGLKDLRADNDTTRLAGARAIQNYPGELPPRAETAVREALALESVPWVRGVLEEILTRDAPHLESGIVIAAPRWDERLEGVDVDVARQTLNMSTKRVLHEVSAVVGRARLAAKSALLDVYASSDTGRQLEFLSEVCAGLRTLASATQTPNIAEFDLSGELNTLAQSLIDDRLYPILAEGPAPFMVTSDWTLLHLAIRNVLINAIEASLTLGPVDNSRAIVLTWGSSPDGSHVTVIDRGPGPGRFLGNVGRAGVSTKEGHLGYGLATASEAMHSLGGEVLLQRNDQGGATVVLSWAEST